MARSAYVHVPFCEHRCGYCNFTLIAGRDDLIPRYLEALERELAQQGDQSEVDTLFFGGGTPTHLPPQDFCRLSAMTLKQFPLASGYEWSVEANPKNLVEATCRNLAELGVTRISIGGQSFADAKLRALDRDHLGQDFTAATQISLAHFPDVSVDLIFSAPDETLTVWENDLRQAIQLRPHHISTYGLTFERGTRFWGLRARGALQSLDEELEGRMYELAIDTLTDAGYEHYEVSNFALPGHRCRHNENYWLGGNFFGVGPGAASYLHGTRRLNHRSPFTYVQRLLSGQSPLADIENLSEEERARERFVFAMRRTAGVSRTWFRSVTGFELDALFDSVLARYLEWGLLEYHEDSVRLTRRGLLISDALWPHFLVPALPGDHPSPSPIA